MNDPAEQTRYQSFFLKKRDIKMNLSTEQLLEIAQFSLERMDDDWFMALAKKLGKETA